MEINEQKIWQFFKSKGLNDFGVAGLMGNLYAESALNPKNLQGSFEKKLQMTDDQYTAAVDNGTYENFINDGAGYGIAQWTYWTRKRDFLNFVKTKKSSIGDLNTQLDFLWLELTTSYPNSLKILKNATSVLEASNEILFNFEKPLNQGADMQQKRCDYGLTIYSHNVKNNEGGNKMKYNSNNKPLECLLKNSTCYKGTSTMTVKGVLWHSTGANNPKLSRYVQPTSANANAKEMIELLGTNPYNNDWNHEVCQAGVNAWIGKTKAGDVTTIQALPWNYRPWGCGSGPNGSCNSGWIQFEICEDDLNDKTYFDKVYTEACELTAYLCKLYNIDPKATVTFNGVKVPTILCHYDSHHLGLGSNHGDVYGWFDKYGKTMDDVRNDVAKLLNGGVTTPSKEEPKKALYKAVVKVNTYLNCRSAASTSSKVVKTYQNGDTVEIFQESKGWGQTDAGWISLAYVKKVESVTVPAASTTTTASSSSFIVRVTASELNVRKGPGTSYAITGVIKDKGSYTIVKTSGNWGYLKSGAGWISLNYTQRV